MIRRRCVAEAVLVVFFALDTASSWAATTIYTSPYAGGTISPGDTVILNNGASVEGNVVNNGTLQFNQTTALTISSTVSGSGVLLLANSGTLNLTGTTTFGNAVALDNSTIVAAGVLQSRAGGGNLCFGYAGPAVLDINGGNVRNNQGILGYSSTGRGSATISSGTWSNSGQLSVGLYGTGTLSINGGQVASVDSRVGENSAAIGVAAVNAGTWSTDGALVIGNRGSGTLSMTGGSVASASGTLGVSGPGVAVVSGGTWSTVGNLTVGVSGTGELTMTGGLVTVGGTLSKGSKASINLGVGGTLQIGSGGMTGALATGLTNNGTLVFNLGNSSSYGGVLAGEGVVVKSGSGTLAVTSSSSYAGGTRITDGILRVSASGGLGSGAITLSGSAKRLVLGDGVTLTNNVLIERPSTQAANGAIQYEGEGFARLATGTVFIQKNGVAGGTFGVIGGGTLYVDSPIIALQESVATMRIGTIVLSGGGDYRELRIGQGTTRLGKDDGISKTAFVWVGYSPGDATLDLAGWSQTVAGISDRLGVAVIGNSSTTEDSLLTVTGSSSYGGMLKDSVAGGNRKLSLAVDGGWLSLTASNAISGASTIRNGVLLLSHPAAIGASAVTVLSGGTLAVASGLHTRVESMSLREGGVVDVDAGIIKVASGMSSTNLAIALKSGRGDGSWGGASGITSSSALASGGSRTVGWLDNGDGSVTFGYAASGDTNLDWAVDILDVANFTGGGKFNSAMPASWAEGDFNYDGMADILDVAEFMSLGLFNAGPYNALAGPIAAVPEPNHLGAMGMAAGVLWFAARRRQRATRPPYPPSRARAMPM